MLIVLWMISRYRLSGRCSSQGWTRTHR